MAHLKCAAWGAGVANLAPFFITISNKSKLNGRKFAGEEPKKYICLRSGGVLLWFPFPARFSVLQYWEPLFYSSI